MTQEPTAETKRRETTPSSSKCLLSWTIDPATGKPVARWISVQPEKTASFALRRAA
jgi:hypothetical protein